MHWLIALILWLPAFIARSQVVSQCLGCHTAQRSTPERGQVLNVGHWQDRECYGCHAETNEVTANFVQGKKDSRISSLWLSLEKKTFIGHNPLPYTQAPIDLHFNVGGTVRMSVDDALAFVRRPVKTPHTTGTGVPSGEMPSFPSLTPAQARDLVAHFKLRPAAQEPTADPAAGREAFNTSCAGCHGDKGASGRGALYLSYLTPEWLAAYANGNAALPDKERTMPVLAVSDHTARAIAAYLRSLRNQATRTVDSTPDSDLGRKSPSAKKLPSAAVAYIWKGFVRDGGCVHCHGGQNAAREAFEASPAGLEHYVSTRDPWELVRRLTKRRREVAAGIPAERPGMPMTRPALPDALIDLVREWVAQGCPRVEGETTCGPAATDVRRANNF